MMDKVQKIRAFLVGIADADGVSTILAKAIENKILPYIDSLQEEPVSMWHNMDEEKPPQGSDVCLLWPRDGIITIGEWNENGLENTSYVSKWAYKDDLLNFSNLERTVKNWKEPGSEELEEASKEWLRPQLDKSYADYGETKMMELTRFDGYAMLDAIEFGAEWQMNKLPKWRRTPIQGGCWSGEIGVRPNARLFVYEHYSINADKLFKLLNRED